jgi:hypothetical protein
MLGFVALTGAAVWRMRAASRSHPHPVVTASWSALAGLAVAACFLQTWLDFSVAWTVWAVAGASLGAARATVALPQPAESPVLGPFAPTPTTVIAA